MKYLILSFALLPLAGYSQISLELQGGTPINSITKDFTANTLNTSIGFLYSLTNTFDWRMQLGYNQNAITNSDNRTYNFTYGIQANILSKHRIHPTLYLGSSFVGFSEKGNTSSFTRFDSSVGLLFNLNRISIGTELYYYFQDIGKPYKTRYSNYPLVLSFRYKI